MTPDSNNLYVGAGEVWFDRQDASGNYTGYRHLGNVTKLDLTTSSDTIDKKSSMTGARGVLKRVVIGSTGELAVSLDEFDPENAALGILGSSATFSQSSGTATDATLGTVKKGYALSTGKLKIVVTGVKKSPSTAAVLGVDYSVDSDSGLITILPTSTVFTDGDTALWSGTYPLIASTQIDALSNGVIRGRLRYRSASDSTGPRYLVDVYKVSFAPDGALALISDAFGEITLKGVLEADTTRAVGKQYFQAVVL